MKNIRLPLMVFPVLVLILALVLNGQTGLAASSYTPTPTATLPPQPPIGEALIAEPEISALTEGQPVHMPDLIGQSLEYAISIWDTDEALPQIRVVGDRNDPNLVIVGQQPAPGTLIDPSQTTIELTLGQGPLTEPGLSPTPMPPSSLLTEALGQATLLRSPYVQNVTTSSVTIVWTTVEGSPSEVHYGAGNTNTVVPATSTYFTTSSSAPYDRYYVHQATLTGLAADTVYQYTIFTNGANLTPGGLASFRSGKPVTAGSFRFAVFGDSGDGSQNQKDVAARLLQVQPNLALHAGDIVYPEASYGLFEANYFKIYKDFLKSTWLAPSMGNKEAMYNNGKSFTDVFVNPTNATSASHKELYYSFDYGNAHFTVLNNYFGMTNIGSAQYNWMVNDLATTNRFWKFVIFHQPPYTTDTEQQLRENDAVVKNLVPLFEKYNVDIVFGGHWHYYERMYPMLGGKVSSIGAGGVVYIVTGGGGAGLSSIGNGTKNPRTAAKFQKFHLTMIDVQGCSLQLSAVQRVSGSGDTFDASDIFDSYTLNRCGEVPPTPVPTATPTRTPAPTPAPKSKDTIGVFRPSNGVIFLKNSNTSGIADVTLNYGMGGDYPVVGDWDGNGTDTIGVYRSGTFLLRNSNTNGFADLSFAFGLAGDQPIAGDWNGDGKDTIGVYRPSTGQFLLRNSNSAGPAEKSFYLGNVGDVGIAGDWNGDGTDTVGVFRPSNGIIFLKNTNTSGFADISLNYGLAGDKPVVGDWDNNRTTTIGVYRNGRFYLRNSNTNGYANIILDFGASGDMPIAGDWDDLP